MIENIQGIFGIWYGNIWENIGIFR